jgi:drug/metabolite transporter (DMT)-like permease
MEPLALGLALASALVHAGWNVLARARGAASPLLRVPIVTTALGIIPAVVLQQTLVPFSGSVWFLLVLSGIFQAWYHTGLTFGYRTGDFTLVYPLARALPVLAIAFVDVARGRAPTPLAWLGMTLVVAGCAIIPHTSLRTLRLAAYRNRALPWIVITALSTVGYSTVDKLAAEQIAIGPVGAATYYVWQMAFTVLPLLLLLRLLRHPTGLEEWRHGWMWPAVVALGVFGSYWLILWAYQVSDRVSYVVALRQFSIVIGVVLGALLFKEPAPGLRIGASLVIIAGMICIAAGG